MTEVTPGQRQEILGCAESFTEDADNVHVILANARPLLKWVQEATGKPDAAVRIRLLAEQVQRNIRRDRVPPDGDSFLEDVRPLYEFQYGTAPS